MDSARYAVNCSILFTELALVGVVLDEPVPTLSGPRRH
jgi:hypothetical protein